MPFDSGTMRVVRGRKRPPAGEIGESVSLEREQEQQDLAEVVSDLSVAEVIELVESGGASLDDVIAAERVGKSRKTILHLVQSDSGKVYPVNKTDRDQTDTDSNEGRD